MSAEYFPRQQAVTSESLLPSCVCFRAALQEPEPHHMLIKEGKAGSARRRSTATPLSLRRQLSKVPPKDACNDTMFVGQLPHLFFSSGWWNTALSVVKVADYCLFQYKV